MNMKWHMYKKYSIILLIIFLFIGCVTTDRMIKKDIILEKVRIIIVNDTSNYESIFMQEFPKKGYAVLNKNEIHIIGKRTLNGKIILEQYVLGHELQHLLNYYDSEIINPDKL